MAKDEEVEWRRMRRLNGLADILYRGGSRYITERLASDIIYLRYSIDFKLRDLI